MLNCAHCKGREVTVEHVRQCSEDQQSTARYFGQSEMLTVQPKPATLAVEPVEGVYFKDGFYFKVQQSQNTRSFYAKVWESPLGDGEYEWTYQGRKPLHSLTAAHRVTAEQAAQFGAVTGQCVFCSRKLTDERSIEVGYGAKCAGREGLPWG